MTRSRESENRVSLQPAFVLHTYPWRETSLIVEAFTRDYGRLSLVARGAKRPMSQYRGMLCPFCPLAISYYGKGDVKNLSKCEWQGTIILPDTVLMAAFYINELLVRLLPRHEPVPRLFSVYFNALRSLSNREKTSACLRSFEVDLLDCLGYGIPQTSPDRSYQFSRGDWLELPLQSELSGVPGVVLQSIRDKAIAPEHEKEAKSVMRDILGYYMEDRPINTRKILTELKKL